MISDKLADHSLSDGANNTLKNINRASVNRLFVSALSLVLVLFVSQQVLYAQQAVPWPLSSHSESPSNQAKGLAAPTVTPTISDANMKTVNLGLTLRPESENSAGNPLLGPMLGFTQYLGFNGQVFNFGNPLTAKQVGYLIQGRQKDADQFGYGVTTLYAASGYIAKLSPKSLDALSKLKASYMKDLINGAPEISNNIQLASNIASRINQQTGTDSASAVFYMYVGCEL